MIDGDLLSALANRLGVLDGYHTESGSYTAVPLETRRALLRGFGINVQDPEVAAAQYRAIERSAARLLPKCIVHTAGEAFSLQLQAPKDQPERMVAWRLVLEGGETYSGETSNRGILNIAAPLPVGYHTLYVKLTANIDIPCSLIVAPQRAAEPDAGGCGLNLSLLRLRSARNWGVGDFEDLACAAEAAAAKGLDFLAVEPVHALFPKAPELQDPYCPSSRHFLNVMLIAPDKVPELNKAPKGKALLRDLQAGQAYTAARLAATVDFKAVYALKWRALNTAFRVMEARKPSNARLKAFNRFIDTGGETLRRHALYETIADYIGSEALPLYDWRKWPEDLHDPESRACRAFAQKHSTRVRFYMFLQWIADAQPMAAQQRALAAGMKIGIALPIAAGPAPYGAEAWSNQQAIATDMLLGEPPVKLTEKAKKWGTAPYDPEVQKDTAFLAFRRTLRHSMRYAGLVFLENIEGLNRSYWLTETADQGGGLVRYPAHAMLGITALEAERNSCFLAGVRVEGGGIENTFRELLQARGLLYVVPFMWERRKVGIFKRPSEYASLGVATLQHWGATFVDSWGSDADNKLEETDAPIDAAHPALLSENEKKAVLQVLADEGLLPSDMNPDEATSVDAQKLQAALYQFIGRCRSHLVVLSLGDILAGTFGTGAGFDLQNNSRAYRRIDVPVETLFDTVDLGRLLSATLAERTR